MGAVIQILLVGIFLFSACSDDTKEVTDRPPNFLILVADDAGYRDLGCYGNENIYTPNIDHLAKLGLKFNNAFLTTAQCSPSRISVLTGKYPHATGAEDLHMPLPNGETLVTTYLKKNNYYSGLLKKSHLGPNGDKQFDFYSEKLNDFELFLDSANSQPFFMWVGFTDPHRPYEKGIIDKPQDPAKVFIPPYFVDNKQTRDDLADYYNEIMRMDKRIGDYFKALEQRDILNNTIIIFFSDNGAPFPREKGTVYDAGIKTPFIIVWQDKIETESVYNGLISLVDLAPTILEIADVKVYDEMQGRSFYNILIDQSEPGRDYIFSERNWHNCDEHIRSVRSSKFKLIANSYINVPHGTAADITKSPT
ncbi:MAG: sulfatase, partial [Ignavibacterium sp.]